MRLAKRSFDLVLRVHGWADPAWGSRREIPGDTDFPVLALPSDRIRFVEERAYPASFQTDGSRLYVQVASYELSEGPGGWAIPAAYRAKDDAQRIRKALGFDEGWENASPEFLLVCDDRWRPFWRSAFQRRVFGVTVDGAATIYPNGIGDIEAEPLEEFLAAPSR
jgi:hypothetical protein